MIDIQTFQALLLLVCILAFIGGVFSACVVTSGYAWVRVVLKLFFAALAVMSGVAGLLLVLLK